MNLITLKHRSEFLRIRGGARWSSPRLLLEGKRRAAAAVRGAMVGSPDLSVGATAPASAVPLGPGPRATPGPLAIQGGSNEPARFGFTVTKKLGCAVVRNRIRRRLREIIRQTADARGLPGCDYVVVARDGALRSAPAELRNDLVAGLAQVNRKLSASRR